MQHFKGDHGDVFAKLNEYGCVELKFTSNLSTQWSIIKTLTPVIQMPASLALALAFSIEAHDLLTVKPMTTTVNFKEVKQ